MAYAIRFMTWTLRYNESLWLRIDEMQQHWEKSWVAAYGSESGFRLVTYGVNALTISIGSGESPNPNLGSVEVVIDEQKLKAPEPLSDRSWTVHFRKEDKKWKVVDKVDDGELRKRHGLQGPIDDAFMVSFLMVRPTGKPMNDKIGAWASAEMKHAIEHWRKQFRGEARVRDDTAASADDIAAHNLVLWGDPSSNQLIAKIAPQLPIKWDDTGIHVGDKTYDAGHHVPLLIYPNPLNPERYVVLNSGFTFREYDYLNNARQVPKLPDWAIVDVTVPPSTRAPGKVEDAGFFGERWELKKSPEK